MNNKNDTKRFLIIWANTTSTKFINYHFTQLGEISDYLDNIFKDEIDILDADAENLDDGEILKQMVKKEYSGIAFYVSSENIRETVNLTMVIKSVFPNIRLFAYGPLTVMIPDFFGRTEFDAIYSDGDNETAIESFFNFISGKIDESQLCGVKLIKDSKLISTNRGKFINFDELGFSRPNRVPIKKYNELNKDHKINLTLSRGCPFSCPHCLVQRCEGHIDRRRNLKKLEEYLETIYPEYTELKIFSPNFTLNKQYVNDFCSLIREKFPKMKWDCATRVDLINDVDLLDNMHKSGCVQITLGVETLSEEELKNIGKKYDVKKIQECIAKIRSCNIIVKSCIILGIEGQTKESLRRTLDILTECGATIRPMVYTPYHELKGSMTVDEIENYNRKFFSTHKSDLTNEQLVRLLYDIKNYREILS